MNLTFKEWEDEGLKLFGEDRMKWRFVCPICDTVISVKDYRNAGANNNQIAFNCIGRFLPKEKCQRAFSEEQLIKGMPCDYTGGGLFRMNPVKVLDDNGVVHELFDFDRSEG